MGFPDLSVCLPFYCRVSYIISFHDPITTLSQSNSIVIYKKTYDGINCNPI